ncbi:MAG: hypothetical protein ACERKN_03255 [Velocimicrobium sp.]
MQFNYIDKRIKEELQSSCQKISASSTLKEKIDAEIKKKSKKEYFMKKRINIKRIAGIVVIASVLMTGTGFAAGKVQSLVSSSNFINNESSFSKLPKEEKRLGYEVKAIETFQNGYNFKEMSVDDVQGMDADNNQVATYRELDITYEKEENEISLNISKGMVTDDQKMPTEKRQIDGILINYNLDTYKFVPENYELTQEDKENKEKDHYYISFGSDEVEVNEVSFLTWEEDGIKYSLMQYDTNLSVDELMDMATQIIASKK